jgi:hypothetical protein
MPFTLRKSVSLDDGSGLTVSGNLSANADLRGGFEKEIADGAANQLISVSVVEGTLVAFALSSTQEVTVKTNSSSSPQETFTLKPGEPVTWINGETTGKPIAGNVTSLYVTNASGQAATLKLITGNTL